MKDLDSVHILKNSRKLIENGNPFTLKDIADTEPTKAQDSQKKEAMYSDGTRVRVYDEDGVFFGVYKYNDKLRNFRVDKNFYTPQ